MLSKEEYLTHLDYGVKTCPAIRDAFKELINEHFKLKENTSEFKHFKLHSDNTLKNLTKKELIDYIKMLYHNWGVCDEQLAHSLNAYNNLEEKYKSIDFILDKQFEHIEEIEKILDVCGIVAIKKRIKELTNIEPYKFEDLKPNMWVWDNAAKECLYVIKPFVGSFTGVKYFSCLGIYKNLEEIRKLDMKFEENRFFPVQYTMKTTFPYVLEVLRNVLHTWERNHRKHLYNIVPRYEQE